MLARIRQGRSLRTIVVGVAAFLIGSASIVVATGGIPGPDGRIYGCYTTSATNRSDDGQSIANGDGSTRGYLRLVSSATECRRNETAIFWNQTGPTGATGPAGPSGAPGATGPAGSAALAGAPCTTSTGRSGAITLATDPSNVITLTCVAPSAQLAFTPAGHDFGIAAAGSPMTFLFSLANTGSVGAAGLSLSISGPGAGAFSLDASATAIPCPVTTALVPGGHCDVAVTFRTFVAGSLSATLTATDTTGGVATATLAGSTLPGSVSASVSTVSASPTTVLADGVATAIVTVTLRDASSNRVPGVPVSLRASPTTGQLGTPAAATTDPAGQAQFYVSGKAAGLVTYSAMALGIVLTQVAQVTFVPGTSSAGTTVLTAAPSTVKADGIAFSAITVVLKDVIGNPIAGHSVSLTSNSTTTRITPANATTTLGGSASFTVIDTVVETVTYTLLDLTAGSVGIKQVTVSFTP